MNQDRFQTLLKRAHGEHRSGNTQRADELYRQALDLDPRHPEALYLLAALHLQTGRPESALALVDRAIARLGRRPELLVNRSSAALATGRTGEACIDAGEAAEGLPQSFGAWFNLGLAEAARHNWTVSERALARALALRPTDPRCQLHWRIAVLHAAPERDRPLDAAVLAEAEQLMEPLAELIGALTGAGRPAQAAELAATVADALPSREPIRRKWIRKIERAGLAITAERLADRLIERFPDSADARLFVAAARQRRGATEAACRDYRRLLEIKPDYWQAHSNYLISMQHSPRVGPAELAKAHAEWARRHAPDARRIPRSHRHRPIRVGWFSPRLMAGPMESFFAGVLEAFPRDGVEHWLYQTYDIADSSTPRFKAAADYFASVADLDDLALADRAVADSIDIAIDLSGHSPHHRLRAFGRRMAPVQVSWLDYFHPTGIPAIDYFFTDRVLGPDPRGDAGRQDSNAAQAAALYGRRDEGHDHPVFLPFGRLCYQPPSLPIPAETEITRDAPRFGCFNRLSKLSDPVLECWAAVLERMPGTELELRSLQFDDVELRADFIARAEKLGLPAGRVKLVGWQPYAALLEAYRNIDVALDPFPFSGCATSADALWMGTPVITLLGETMVARQTASLLQHAGLQDWVARSPEDYIELACKLAADFRQLRLRRGQLRQHVVERTGDCTAFATDLEQRLAALHRDSETR